MAMAVSAASFDESDLVYFECPVCMNEINDSWKLLPCQHVFCLECLTTIYRETRRPQRPRCPTCRDKIYTPLKFLRKPRLLFDLYEKYRANQEKRTATDTDDTSGDLSLAIKLQEIEDEKWRKKQEEVYNETDDESCDEDDDEERNLVTAAKLLSLSDERRKEKEIATENEHVQIALCKSRDEVSLREKMESFFSIEEKDFTAALELSIQANLLNVKNFNNHLTGQNSVVLDTILTMIANEEALKSLESSELILYLDYVERYLQALERYRKNQVDKIVQDFGECSKNFERGSSVKNDGDSGDKKDNDLIGLIRALEMERNEDAILKVVLKNSELVDPIDTLHRQFLEIKQKLADVLASRP